VRLRQQQGDATAEATTAAQTENGADDCERMETTTDVENGQDIIDELLKHTTSPEFCYAHGWRRGDCVIWDNRCTLHAPSAFDDSKERRLMWRYVQLWMA
jgi:alpha-ketoglutarate-dependent taurine dioxygenase